MTAYDLKGDTAAALSFLTAKSPAGPWHLAAIIPDSALTPKTFLSSQQDDMSGFIEQWNGRANLYVHVNRLKESVRNAKATKNDVAAAEWVHIDIDDLSALPRLVAFHLPPTVVVRSGGGFNVYWRLAEPLFDLSRAERVNKWLVEQLEGDAAAIDVSRILRLPGTVNLPTRVKAARGRTATVAELDKELTDWARTYSIDQFGEVSSPERHSITAPTPVDAEIPTDVSEDLKRLATEGDDPERPRGEPKSRFKSRSEAVFALVCGLLRAGVAEELVAGILLNPRYRISDSILEKRDPRTYAIRQVERAAVAVGRDWPDGLSSSGKPKPSFQNTQAALLRLDVRLSFDQFKQRMLVEGVPLQNVDGELDDKVVLALRDLIDKTYRFDPGSERTRDAVTRLCMEGAFDPLRDYLDSLVWDQIPRLDRWLVEFAGAEDTDYVRAVGAMTLIAAVRRVRQPGVKYDTILVLEGPQGSGKSSLIKLLAGED